MSGCRHLRVWSAVLAAAVGTPLLAGSAQAASHAVKIANFEYSPTPLTIDVGDSITWSNEGFITHTVTAADGMFDSGNLKGGTTFSFTFTSPGDMRYACSIHPQMHGEVIVKGAHGDGHGGSGGGAHGGPAPQPPQPRPGVGASGPTGITLRLSRIARQHGRFTAIAIRTTRPGARILLELYSREHFSWRQVAHTTADAAGKATLRLRPTVHLPLRVVVPGLAGEAASISAVLHT
jgi:plastocyanin